MAVNQKDTIYVDVDDEITAVIDKVQQSQGKVIALVLPKRAPVFQSVVNMKLLKRTAAEQRKNVVLITSEASVLPLAGATGLHVAKTLQSKPSVPTAPDQSDNPVSVDDGDTDSDVPAAALPSRPTPIDQNEESIEVDNDTPDPSQTDEIPPIKPVKNSKLKVPNFEAFRTRLLLLSALGVFLIGGLVWALVFAPRATILVKTDMVDVDTSMTLTASTAVKEADAATGRVPGELKEYKKSDTQKVAATGKKDMGTKAHGSVTLSLTDCSKDQVSIPSGTGISSGGMTFSTQADVLLKSVKIGPQCRNSDFKDFSTATVNVTANEAGDKYNLSARSYTVAGFSNVSAAGTAMIGGTSKLVTIVSQDDINNAKQKILDTNKDTAQAEVKKQLTADGFMALEDTFNAADPLVTASPNVGDEAADVTVNVATSYTMFGASQAGIKQLLEADIKKRIDTTKQTILNNGLGNAVIKVATKDKESVQFSVEATASAGVQQDAEAIKKAVAGKKKGDIESQLSARPGVKGVTVTYSPFWVYKTPSSTKKITVNFQQSNGTTTGNR